MIRILLFILLASTAWAARASIEWEEEVEVPVGRILLGSLAEIEGDAELVAKLKALSVGRMELPGRDVRISISTVQNFYLKSICSLDSLEIDKQEFVMVHTKSGELDRDSLQALLLRVLLPLTRGEYGEDWELDASKLPLKTMVPDGAFTTKMEIPARYDGRGSEMATLRIQIDGKDKMKIALPFVIRRWATVVRSVANIQRGQKIRASDIAVERQEVTNQQRLVVSKLDEAIGRTALRTISRDQDLQEAWLEKPWVVKEGEQVRMNVEFGQALVSVVGVARSNGYLGQRIEVENVQTGKRMQAEIDAPGEVRVLN